MAQPARHRDQRRKTLVLGGPKFGLAADGAEDVRGADAVIMGRSCPTSGHASNDKRSADISSLDNLRIKSLRPSIFRWRMNDT